MKTKKDDRMTIEVLERQVESSTRLAEESQKEMYEALEYLRYTNRFKENARYKKSDFWAYLDDRFAIKEKHYLEYVRVYTRFPAQAMEYGVGMVARIERICGSKKIKMVFDEIEREQSSHKKPLSRAKIEQIIQKWKWYSPDNKV